MQKIIMALVITGAFFSCKQPVLKNTVVKAPVDSLIKNWSKGWNDHDSAAVGKLFTSDALLIDDNLIADDANKITDKWISPNINVVNHFKATPLQEWSTNDRAGYTGKYEFDAIVKDSVVASPKGFFTLVWIKTDSGEWKITTAVIHGFIEKK